VALLLPGGWDTKAAGLAVRREAIGRGLQIVSRMCDRSIRRARKQNGECVAVRLPTRLVDLLLIMLHLTDCVYEDQRFIRGDTGQHPIETGVVQSGTSRRSSRLSVVFVSDMIRPLQKLAEQRLQRERAGETSTGTNMSYSAPRSPRPE
jgi:hypothetical protein